MGYREISEPSTLRTVGLEKEAIESESYQARVSSLKTIGDAVGVTGFACFCLGGLMGLDALQGERSSGKGEGATGRA